MLSLIDESVDINVNRTHTVYVKAIHPETRKAWEFYVADIEVSS